MSPKATGFQDLFGNPVLRFIVWMISLTAIVLKLFVLVHRANDWLSRKFEQVTNSMSVTFLIINLALADMMIMADLWVYE